MFRPYFRRDTPRETRPRRPLWTAVWLLGALLGIELIYVWLTTAGTWRSVPIYLSSIDKLATAFLAGHVYVLEPPNPELLRAADPYDRANSRLWMVDLSLWKDRYYLYWGPVPALVAAAAKLLVGYRTIIPEHYLALLFASVAGLSSSILTFRIAAKLFPAVPGASVTLAMFAIACAAPTLHLLTTGNTYTVAILGGQAFLVLGLLFAFEAIGATRRWPVALFLSSACFGLAVGCRASLAPAVGVLAILAGFLVHPPGSGPRRRFAALSCSLLPLGALSLAHLVYNWVRFENPLEFGTNLQTGYLKFSFHVKYLLTNLYMYLFQTPGISCHFPYFFQRWFPPVDLPFKAPKGYLLGEPVVGLIWSVPALLLAPLALRRPKQLWRLESRTARAKLFVVLGCSVAIPLAGFVPWGLYMATMRYQGDLIFCAAFLAVVGYFSLWDRGTWRHRLARGAVAPLLLATILAGLALGYHGYNGHFYANNRALDRQLRATLSVCPAGPSYVPRFVPTGGLDMK